MFGLNHQFGAPRRIFDIHVYRADLADLFFAFLAKLNQTPQASHVAFAPCGDAFVQPLGFFGDFFVEMFLGDDFLFDHLVLPFFKAAETFVVAAQGSAVEPEGGARNVGEKTPVVADDDDGAAVTADDFFQFFDGRHVEVVGWFVQKQNVRFFDQCPGQRRFAPFTAGSGGGVGVGGNFQLFDPHVGFVVFAAVVFVKSGGNRFAQGLKTA